MEFTVQLNFDYLRKFWRFRIWNTVFYLPPNEPIAIVSLCIREKSSAFKDTAEFIRVIPSVVSGTTTKPESSLHCAHCEHWTQWHSFFYDFGLWRECNACIGAMNGMLSANDRKCRCIFNDCFKDDVSVNQVAFCMRNFASQATVMSWRSDDFPHTHVTF